jgi:hypothetical protein
MALTKPITAPRLLLGRVSAGTAQKGANPAKGPMMAKQRKAKDNQKEYRLASTLPIKQTPLTA